MDFVPGVEASISGQERSGSLLSREAMGGLRGGGGFDAERDYILARLHVWLSEPSFRAIQIEGLTEVELAFEENAGHVLEYHQIKDHPVGLTEGRQILIDFLTREQSSPGPQYREYVLACKDMIGDMGRIREAIERYRRAAIYTDAEKVPTLDDIETLLVKLGIQMPAQFLVDKVDFDTDGDWLKSEELRRSLFKTRFVDLPGYRLDTTGAGRVYTELLASIELSRGKTISRDQIEEVVCAEELPLPAPAIFPDPSEIVRYAEALQSWAIAYQEDIIGWGGVYTPLQTQRLPIHVMHVLHSRNRLNAGDGPQTVLDAIRVHRKLILVGDPGSGKTTTALKVAYDLAERLKADVSLPIPVVVPLRELSPRVDLTTLIRNSLARHGLCLKPEIVEQLTLSSDCLYLILEGINEIGRAAREAGIEAELAQVVHTVRGGVLVTTRREGYDPQLFQGLPAVEILPLSRFGMETFLREHFPDVAEQLLAELESTPHEEKHRSASLLELARNPLLLTMLAVVYRDSRKLPSNLGELLETFTTYIIRRESQKGSRYSSEARVVILEHVAATMFKTGRRVSLERLSLESIMVQALDDLKCGHYVPFEATVGDMLTEIDRRVFRFLRSTLDKRVIEWEHPLFQEYYAASWLRLALLIVGEPDARLTVLKETIGLEWIESVRMLVGILTDDQAAETIKVLLNLDPLLGAEAFAAARSTVQDELEPALLNALEHAVHDEDPDTRQEAARALGRLGAIAAPGLFPALGDGDYRVRREVAESLDRIALDSLYDLDLLARRMIRRQLSQHERYIERACHDNDPLVLRWSTWLLAEMLSIGSLPDKMEVEARRALEAGLHTSDFPTKFAAARAMARLGTQGLVVLAELALTEGGDMGESARAAFEKLPPSRRIRILVDLAATHSDDLVRERAQHSLADYGEEAARATMKDLDHALEEKDSRAVHGLVSALGFIGGASAVGRLVQLLDPSEPELCAAAAVALGHTRDPEGIIPLMELLQCQGLPTNQRVVWQGAARGLTLLGEVVLPYVADFAQRELAEPALAPLVLDILADAGAEGIQPLVTILEHEQPQVRAEAVVRLGWLRATEATDRFLLLTADPDAHVRAAAMGALYAVEGSKSVPVIMPLLDDPSASVREEAARILIPEHEQEAVLCALVTHMADYVVKPYARRALLAAGEAGIPVLLMQLTKPASKITVHQLLVEIGPACVEPLKAILNTPTDPRRPEVPAILTEILGHNATSLIRPLLQDPSPKMRMAVLEALFSLEIPELENTIIEALDDPAADVRRVSTREAGRWATPFMARALVARLTDRDADVRQAAVASLEGSGHLAVDELVALATGRASPTARNAARDVLLSLPTGVLPHLVRELQTTRRPKVVSLVSDVLCHKGLPAFKALVPLLDSQTKRTRQRAAEILARDKVVAIKAILGHLRKNPELSEGLRSFLQPLDLRTIHLLANELAKLGENDVDGRAIIGCFLTRFADENEFRDIFEMMMTRPEHAVRRELFSVLQETGHLDVQRLGQVALSNPPPACNHALEALGWVGTAEALLVVAEAMAPSRSVEIRRTSCRVLSEARSAVCLPTLIAALHDSDGEVRCLAIWGLGHFEDAKVVEALAVTASDPVPAVRLEVIRSLGQTGDLSAFQVFRDRMYCDEDPGVACAAATALGKILHPEAPSALLGVVFGDHSESVRLAAAKALSQKDTSTVESLLPEYLDSFDNATSIDFELLEHIGPAATSTLLLTLVHPSEEVLLQGLNALCAIGDTRAQEAVIDLVHKALQTLASCEVLVAICKTLGSVGDEQAIPILDQLQRDHWHWRDGRRIVGAAAAAKEHIEQRL